MDRQGKYHSIFFLLTVFVISFLFLQCKHKDLGASLAVDLEYKLPNGDSWAMTTTTEKIEEAKQLQYRNYQGIFYKVKDSLLGNYSVFVEFEGVTNEFYSENKSFNKVFDEIKNINVQNYSLVMQEYYRNNSIAVALKKLYMKNQRLEIYFDTLTKENKPYEVFNQLFYCVINGQKFYLGSIIYNKNMESNNIKVMFPLPSSSRCPKGN